MRERERERESVRGEREQVAGEEREGKGQRKVRWTNIATKFMCGKRGLREY